MKITDYIKDKKYLVIFFSFILSFISTVVYLDKEVDMQLYNIVYFNFVSIVFFLLYVFVEYIMYKKYYKNIIDIIEKKEESLIFSLPEPKTYEQKINNELLWFIYSEKIRKNKEILEEQKDNLEFITSWVHDIKTPIAVSKLVIENNDSKTKEEVLYSIEEEIEKIERDIDKVLYYVRSNDFAKDYLINEIDMDKLIKEIIKNHAKIFISKRIKIEIENTNYIINSDKKWLAFIINQIVANSLKYTNEYGSIKIFMEKNEKEAKLIIKDNGTGIKQEDLGRVFDRSFTGYNGRKSKSSTGMGLYLAQKLAKKLGHYITIDSKYKEFTEVTIHFPKLLDYINIAKN